MVHWSMDMPTWYPSILVILAKRLEKFRVAGRREALLQPEKRHSDTASVKQCHEKLPIFLGMVFTYIIIYTSYKNGDDWGDGLWHCFTMFYPHYMIVLLLFYGSNRNPSCSLQKVFVRTDRKKGENCKSDKRLKFLASSCSITTLVRRGGRTQIARHNLDVFEGGGPVKCWQVFIFV